MPEGKNIIPVPPEEKANVLLPSVPEVKGNIDEKPTVAAPIEKEKKEEQNLLAAPVIEEKKEKNLTSIEDKKPENIVTEKKEENLTSIQENKPENIAAEKIEKNLTSVEEKRPENIVTEKKEIQPKEEQKLTSPKKDVNEEKRCDILEQLFSFLKVNEVNPTLAGYFAKAIEGICERRKSDLMKYLTIFREHEQNILKHSYNKSLADVIHKLLANDECFRQEESVDEFVEDRKRILRSILQKMRTSSSRDDINNNCAILCNLIEVKQHLPFFISEPVIKEIFDAASSLNPYSISGALTLLTTLNKLKAPPKPAQITNMFSFQMHPGIFFI
jgi:hypothetical protein